MAHVYGMVHLPKFKRRVKASFMLMNPRRKAEYIKWWRDRDAETYMSLLALNVFATKAIKDSP